MRRAVAVLAAAWGAACFTKPAFDGGGDDAQDDAGTGDDAGRDDGMTGPDAAPPPCTSIFSDDFSAPATGNACGPWGMISSSSSVTVSRQTGELRMTFAGGGSGGCTSMPMKFANGTSIRLPMPITSSQYTGHELTVTDTTLQGTTRLAVVHEMGGQRIEMRTHGGQTFTTPYGTGMKWLRLMPITPTSKTVDAAYSNDGANWMSLGTDTYPSGIGMVVVGISVIGSSTNASVHWDDFNIKTCPPP